MRADDNPGRVTHLRLPRWKPALEWKQHQCPNRGHAENEKRRKRNKQAATGQCADVLKMVREKRPEFLTEQKTWAGPACPVRSVEKFLISNPSNRPS